MAIIKCYRCDCEKEALTEPPFNNELGQMVLKHTCQDCWKLWVGQQLMIMNEYHLDPLNDEHSIFLDQEMKKFLNLTS